MLILSVAAFHLAHIEQPAAAYLGIFAILRMDRRLRILAAVCVFSVGAFQIRAAFQPQNAVRGHIDARNFVQSRFQDVIHLLVGKFQLVVFVISGFDFPHVVPDGNFKLLLLRYHYGERSHGRVRRFRRSGGSKRISKRTILRNHRFYRFAFD